MKRWKKIALISSGTILLLFFATLSAFNYFSLKMVELHQKSVTDRSPHGVTNTPRFTQKAMPTKLSK